MSNECQVQRTVNWFKEAKPNPVHKDFNVQLGVHFEEISEMLETLVSTNRSMNLTIQDALSSILSIAKSLKSNEGIIMVSDPVEFLDSLCDQYVTALGSAHFFEADIVGAVTETNDSNYSKFVDGKAVFNEQGKIAKGPDYFKPDLNKFIS